MDNVWILAFNKATGDRVSFTCCNKNQAKFYESKYSLEGYDVKTLDDDEIDEYISNEKRSSKG